MGGMRSAGSSASGNEGENDWPVSSTSAGTMVMSPKRAGRPMTSRSLAWRIFMGGLWEFLKRSGPGRRRLRLAAKRGRPTQTGLTGRLVPQRPERFFLLPVLLHRVHQEHHRPALLAERLGPVLPPGG